MQIEVIVHVIRIKPRFTPADSKMRSLWKLMLHLQQFLRFLALYRIGTGKNVQISGSKRLFGFSIGDKCSPGRCLRMWSNAARVIPAPMRGVYTQRRANTVGWFYFVYEAMHSKASSCFPNHCNCCRLWKYYGPLNVKPTYQKCELTSMHQYDNLVSICKFSTTRYSNPIMHCLE